MKSRNSTYVRTFGKMIGTFFTGTLMVVAVVGCSIPDHRVVNACRIDQSTGEYEDYGWCQRMRETVSQEKAWEIQEQLDAEDAEYDRRARARGDSYVSPSAANDPDAIERRTEHYREIREMNANSHASTEAIASWNLEYQLAESLENSVNHQNYPDLAPFSGIWCWRTDAEEGSLRNEIRHDGSIRVAAFKQVRDGRQFFGEYVYAVRRDSGRIIITREPIENYYDMEIKMLTEDTHDISGFRSYFRCH